MHRFVFAQLRVWPVAALMQNDLGAPSSSLAAIIALPRLFIATKESSVSGMLSGAFMVARSGVAYVSTIKNLQLAQLPK